MQTERQELWRSTHLLSEDKKDLARTVLEEVRRGRDVTRTLRSHPLPGEKTQDAAVRRLQEELGFETPLEKVFDFVYKAEFDNGLTEFEFDHVFTGEYEGKVSINPEEVSEYCYKEIAEIKNMLQTHPKKFTAWFHLAFPKIEEWWTTRYQKISTE